jgi:hypothetical protein
MMIRFSFHRLSLLGMALIGGAAALSAADFAVSHGGTMLTVTDLSGLGDVLQVTSPSAGRIQFSASGRTFSLNGEPSLTGSTGPLTLGATQIVINAGAGNDTITITLPGAEMPSLTIQGGTGDDHVTFAAGYALAAGRSLDCNLLDDGVAGVRGIDAITVSGVALTASGDGAISLGASSLITCDVGSSLTTVHGAITVETDQRILPAPTSLPTFRSITLRRSSLRSTGTGSITVRGTAQTRSYSGVAIYDGTQIQTQSGAIRIEGAGGSMIGSDHTGVAIADATTLVTSATGAITLHGTSGVASSTGSGIRVGNQAEIRASANAPLTLQGEVWTASPSLAHGVSLTDANTRVTSQGGAILIEGRGPANAAQGEIGGWGLHVALGASVRTTAPGAHLTLRVSSLTVDGASVLSTSGVGSELALSALASQPLTVAAAAQALRLTVTDAILDRLSAPRLVLGAGGRPIVLVEPISRQTVGDVVLRGLSGTGAGVTATAHPLDVSLASGGTLVVEHTLAMEFQGTAAGGQYQPLSVNGAVQLSGSLALSGTYAGAVGNVFSLVENDGTDAVSGLFTGLPEGAIVLWPGSPALAGQISYVGGTGNDVVLTLVAAPAWIPVTGPTSYSQNFDTLPSATTAWADSSTLHGWLAQINNGATASGQLQVNDGVAALNGLLNLGAAGSTDRALGFRPTGTGVIANIAYAVVFKNVGLTPLRLAEIAYTQELWRSTNVANSLEKITPFYAITSAPLASIQSGGNTGTAEAGSSFLPLPAALSRQISNSVVSSALDGNDPLNRNAVDHLFEAATAPVLLPGQYLTLKWTDANEANIIDGAQGLDEVRISFDEPPCLLSATLTAVERQPGTDLASLTDDTVDLSLRVTGRGSDRRYGMILGVNQMGVLPDKPYDTVVTVPGIPVALFAPTLAIRIIDRDDSACEATLTAALPLSLGLNTTTAPASYWSTASMATNFRATSATDLTADPGTGTYLTATMPLVPGSAKCLSLLVEATDTSTASGFEVSDTLAVLLRYTVPSGERTIIMTRDYAQSGTGVMMGSAVSALLDDFNAAQAANAATWTSAFPLVALIPAEATACAVEIQSTIVGGAVGTASEILRFKNGRLEVCADPDGDGQPSAVEAAQGTDPGLASSVLRPGAVSKGGAQIVFTLPTVPGRTYQSLTSTDLLTWRRTGLPFTGTGAAWTPPAAITPGQAATYWRFLALPAPVVQP